MGAGDGSSIAFCSAEGDDGVFRFAASGTCAASGLDAGATFLVDSGGANAETNFGNQDLKTAFQCIADLGVEGCGFQMPLAAAARALGADGVAAPSENAGFLREDAVLAIVLLSKEDDCSAPRGSPLFNPTSVTLSSTYGPTAHFLCNEWGHLCVPPGGGSPTRPSRFAPNNLATDTVTYSPAGGPDDCVSAEGQGLLLPVATGGIADGIKGLKPDASRPIVVVAITGATTAYTIHWASSPAGNNELWPVMNPSCSNATNGAVAKPAVRTHQFVSEFGANGIFGSLCDASYASTFVALATELGQLVGP
jgi:hypothetical protein